MGVYIKGMKMPKEGTVIAIYKLKNKLYASIHGTELCPLVGIPEPHGALIDRDALNIGEYEREDDDTGTLEISIGGLLDLYHKVKDAPIVIEAEGSENHDT